MKNKVVLITGAGKGAGKLLARELAKRGAILALNDISPMNVEQVADEIRGAKTYIEDVAKKVGAQALVNGVEDDFGNIDALIYHAEVEPRASLLSLDEWDWHRALDVNLTGAFLTIQSAARVMREKGSGVIIGIGAPLDSREGKSASYLTGKAGLAELCRRADAELRPLGIRVHMMENSPRITEEVISILEEQWKS